MNNETMITNIKEKANKRKIIQIFFLSFKPISLSPLFLLCNFILFALLFLALFTLLRKMRLLAPVSKFVID